MQGETRYTPLRRAVSGIPWMCEASVLQRIMSTDLRPYMGLIPGQTPAQPPAYPDSSKRGPGYDLNNGVAIIPVHGVLYRHSSFADDYFAFIFGGISVDALSDAFRGALSNPDAKSILFSFDSGGGEAAGIGELAATIRAGASVKPVAAYVENYCCSAAYYLASACGEITSAPNAAVGSIGVVIPLVDDSGYQEMTGVVDNAVFSDQSPDKWPDATTDQGKALYQSLVNASAAVFISDVATYRGTTPEAVMADFGKGWVKIASEAKKVGMIDKIGDLASVIKKLSGQNRLRLAAHSPTARLRLVKSA